MVYQVQQAEGSLQADRQVPGPGPPLMSSWPLQHLYWEGPPKDSGHTAQIKECISPSRQEATETLTSSYSIRISGNAFLLNSLMTFLPSPKINKLS